MAIKDLMYNYYYGKQGKRDFTESDLPANRRELFGAVLKVRWSGLVGVNLLYLVIWIPAILWTVLNLMAGVLSDGTGALMTTYMLGLFPCIAITGPFNAGVTYVLRNWARDEHSFVLSDFKDTVKENWRPALAVSVVSGLMPVTVFVAARFYGDMLQRSPVFIAPVALVLLAGIMWSLAEMLIYPMMVTYNLRLGEIVRNAMLMTIGKLPFAFLFRALTLVLPVVAIAVFSFAPQAGLYVAMGVAVLYILFMLAFNKLLTVSYANWLCETFLNSRIEGARTDIGLRPRRDSADGEERDA